MLFKSRIKILAAEKELNLLEVAKKSKVSRTFIYDLANGNLERVTIAKLKALKDFFNCEISDLIDFPKELENTNQGLKTVDNQEEYVLNSSQKNNIK